MSDQLQWDTPGKTWDDGTWDSSTAQRKGKTMKAKVALNLTYLKPREQLAKFQAAINKCTGNTAIGTTNPTLTNCQSSLDAAKGVLDNIDAEELKLTNLRVQRDQSLEMAMSAYGLLGSFVENK